MASLRKNVTKIVNEHLAQHGTIQSRELAQALGVTRQAAHRHLRKLVVEGMLVREGQGRGTCYRLVSRPASDRAEQRFIHETAGLEEDRAWRDLVVSCPSVAALHAEMQGVFEYAFTELVNNVIDHSGAPDVHIAIETESSRLTLTVVDRGIGIFENLCQGLGLSTHLEALQELSKGKTTTMPDRHSGEGIFFVSKAADWFSIESAELGWRVDNERDDMAVMSLAEPVLGTTVRFEADLRRPRSLRSLFDRYTDDLDFARTRIVVRLFEYGTSFVSRSEGKRLVHRLHQFREVILDFEGVQGVGQGFADEVFRVWARGHPDVALRPIRMNEAVQFMIDRARRGEPGERGGPTQR